MTRSLRITALTLSEPIYSSVPNHKVPIPSSLEPQMWSSPTLYDLGDDSDPDCGSSFGPWKALQCPSNSTITRLVVSPYSFIHYYQTKSEYMESACYDCLSAVGSFVSHLRNHFRSHCDALTCTHHSAYCWSGLP